MNLKITFSVLIFAVSVAAQAQPGLQSISGGAKSQPEAQSKQSQPPGPQVEIPSCDSGKRTSSPLVLKAMAETYLNKANIFDKGRIFLEDYHDKRRQGSQATITIANTDPVQFHYSSSIAGEMDLPGSFCLRAGTIVGKVTRTYTEFFQQKKEQMMVEVRNAEPNEIRAELRGLNLDFVAIKVIKFKQVYNEKNQLVTVQEPYENNFVYTTEKETPKVQQQMAREGKNAAR